MSQDQNSGSATPDAGSNQVEDKKDFVPAKAYEEVSRDMHKFKKEREEMKAALTEMQTQLKLQEEAKMQEQEQYKELFQKRDAELEAERKRAELERSRYTKAVKISALKNELGGKVKDVYLNLANVEGIVVNEDGTVDSESVRNVANDFRKEHGQVIPQSEAANITGHAPSQTLAPVDTSRMTGKQLAELYAQSKSKQ